MNTNRTTTMNTNQTFRTLHLARLLRVAPALCSASAVKARSAVRSRIRERGICFRHLPVVGSAARFASATIAAAAVTSLRCG